MNRFSSAYFANIADFGISLTLRHTYFRSIHFRRFGRGFSGLSDVFSVCRVHLLLVASCTLPGFHLLPVWSIHRVLLLREESLLVGGRLCLLNGLFKADKCLVTYIAAYLYVKRLNSWSGACDYLMGSPKLSGLPFGDACRYVDWPDSVSASH